MASVNLIIDTGKYQIWTYRTNHEVLKVIYEFRASWTAWIDNIRKRLEQEQRRTLDRDEGLIAMLEHYAKLDSQQVIEVMVKKHVRLFLPLYPDQDNDGTKFERNMYVNANELDGFEWDKVIESFRNT